MAAIETLQTKIERVQSAERHYGALLRALSPDPEDWEYTGECLDTGHDYCACGHAIRWAFLLRRKSKPTKMVQVGSTCICHFQNINETTYQHLVMAEQELSEQLKAAKKQAKKAAQEKQVQAARQQFETLYTQAHDMFQAYHIAEQRAPRALWEVIVHHYNQVPKNPPEYQRVSALQKWYERKICQLQDALKGCVCPEDPTIVRQRVYNSSLQIQNLQSDFLSIYNIIRARCAEYLTQNKRVPKPLWKVCLSDYYHIPAEPPLNLTGEQEIIDWYIDNIYALKHV